jgi:hypothetical protein
VLESIGSCHSDGHDEIHGKSQEKEKDQGQHKGYPRVVNEERLNRMLGEEEKHCKEATEE